ncbi:MAG: sugar nucleotide-binding protein [Candidatus Paceibacterota bacterium]|jgi:dTDP-4-dehydrorhamnose reductase
MQNRILITGGTGRLATELKKHLEGNYVGSKDFDFTQDIPKEEYDLILHIGAYTDVKKAEFEDQKKCFMVNVYGTFNLVEYYKNTPFIFISTEFAHNPFGVYALTKKLGEEIVKTHPAHLILRTLFKPNPFPFPKAYIDQYTQGDYVDVIAELLAKKVKEWDRKTCKLEYLGTGRKTMFELAKRTRPDVKPNSVNDYIKETGMFIPTDYE